MLNVDYHNLLERKCGMISAFIDPYIIVLKRNVFPIDNILIQTTGIKKPCEGCHLPLRGDAYPVFWKKKLEPLCASYNTRNLTLAGNATCSYNLFL